MLIYRPIRDAGEIAAKACSPAADPRPLRVVFNEEFTDLSDAEIQSGADIGDAIGTRNGMDGDRELLFLGRPANHAAKLLPKAATGA